MDSPLLSVFTPTHLPTYIEDCYDSLKIQGYKNWEWVILLNGKAASGEIPERVRRDSKVRIHKSDSSDPTIGQLKKEACGLGCGDVLVELDHDDLLAPFVLEDVARAFHEGADFIYSDPACFETSRLRPHVYHSSFGWVNYPVRIYGHDLMATKMMPITPRALCEIYFSPDHVRCWSSDFYEKLGGHDGSKPILDDHELMIRSYLNKGKFSHTGRCGYLYRFHSRNTVRAVSSEIQSLNLKHKAEYLEPLIKEWCRRTGYPSLNLTEPRLIDKSEGPFGLVEAHDILPFFDGKELVQFFNKAYEALVPGGYLIVSFANADHGRGTTYSPLHKSRLGRFTLEIFSDYRAAKHTPGIQSRFQLVHAENGPPDEWHEGWKIDKLKGVFCALKGQRQPGRCYI